MKLKLSSSAQRDLDKLTDEVALRISEKIYPLAQNPFPFGYQKLAGGKGYRIRISDYRIIYQVDKKSKTITILKIAHRREVYR